ncbi:MAG: transcriptional regulator [Cyanobacteriota bacterium]|nr:transcriptional regulator [Cyanobacteriota bacterium]
MQNTTPKSGKTTPGSRSDRLYLALLEKFPPRPISSEEQLEATQEVIDSLISRPQLTQDEQDYLNVLGSLVLEYEELYHSLPTLHGVKLIEALLAELNLDTEDLICIFQSKDRAADVLNNEEDLTVREVKNLAEFFRVSPAAFLEQN